MAYLPLRAGFNLHPKLSTRSRWIEDCPLSMMSKNTLVVYGKLKRLIVYAFGVTFGLSCVTVLG